MRKFISQKSDTQATQSQEQSHGWDENKMSDHTYLEKLNTIQTLALHYESVCFLELLEMHTPLNF